MKKSIFFAIVTFGFLLLPGIVFAAQNSNPVGELSYIEGRVDRKNVGGMDYVPVVKGEPVFAGDTLRTKGYSRAEVSFNDKSIVKIGENSQVEIRDYVLSAAGVRENVRLFIDRGILRVIVSHSVTGANNFFIDTPNSMGAVKGSDICVSYLKSASTFLAISGAVETHHQLFPDKAVMVAKGTTTFVPADAPPVTARPYFPVEQDRFEDDTAPMLAKGDNEILPADLSHGVITAYSGDVRTRAKGTPEWHRAALKESLGEGDEIETGENGSLRLVLESGRIIELKANTQLTIKKFMVDPKTRQREDLLASSRGELRARIEKLKAGSKFQVTTPTAVAAVRGTIMYLNISPTLTHAFFEAGQGSLTSLITGIEKLIDPGQNAQADGQGGVTDPVATTAEQHQELENSFNAQEQTYGYSSPDGDSPNMGSFGDGDGSNDPNFSDGQGNEGFVFDGIPVDVPTTDNADKNTSVTDLEFNIDEAALPLSESKNGVAASLKGTINNFSGGELLWSSYLTKDTSDGGSFVGFSGGAISSDVSGTTLAGIYLNPDGHAGVLFGSLEGDASNDSFSGEGQLRFRHQADLELTPANSAMPCNTLTSVLTWVARCRAAI
ncbi:MAG: hypothetical protein AUJ71_04430 [Candidatus Omnitrophica bacterium CG1_02_49_16]|nr:MAG: hypothetical protein AUJ71_04430 [Candidatus Omnitrophica bacterium CG1_02_49_16]